LCGERTWVMPAHDRDLMNFNQEGISIDLASSAVAWNMATAAWLLQDRLPLETRELIARNVDERVLTPFTRMYRGEADHNWWMHTTNNWNAVCLAGVTGAALAQIVDRRHRAEFVAAAELYSQNFLNGFTEDGYCSEGLGYWNYGFGNYVYLADTVWQATDGGVDLLARPGAVAPALFGARIQIIGEVAPAFADCSINARPSSTIMWYLNERFDMGLERWSQLPLASAVGSLPTAMIFSFPNAATLAGPPAEVDARPGIRTFFDDAGILICRPADGSETRIGVALKGGHNAEHHNHNDVGSYAVVVDDRAVLLDPGGEVYTARTFSSRRYEGKLLNSYGHPVPRVAGRLQETGRERAAKVLSTDFSDERDSITMDLSAAYDVPELETLERTFVYSRDGAGSLSVTDRVVFSEPQEFETALITDGDWMQRDDGTLVIWEVDRALQATIEVEGADYEIVADEIHEDATAQPTRLAIVLAAPVTEATVTVVITPLAELGSDDANLLRNGGFEYRSFGWSIPNDGLAELSEERAASGSYSLKITDASDEAGSNVTSGRMEATGEKRHRLSGRILCAEGTGLGLYVRFYDADGELLNVTSERGHIGPVLSLGEPTDGWRDFEAEFETPTGTTQMDLWIHSYNAAQITAWLDDLRIELTGE